MNKTSFRITSIRNALIFAGLAVGFGIGSANAASADTSSPQPHSDGMSAAVADTARMKAKLMGKDSLNKSDINATTTNDVVTLEGK